MCGRFVQTPIRDAASLGFPQLVGDPLSLPASYNLVPTKRASLVLDRGDGLQVKRRLARGLLPLWAKSKGPQGSTINARIETVASEPAFRSDFKVRRCLIPMAGYNEWSVNSDDKKKDPWFIHAATPLWAAGLWEEASVLLGEGKPGHLHRDHLRQQRRAGGISTTACRCGWLPARPRNGSRPTPTTPWQCCSPASRRRWTPIASAAT